MRPRTVLLAALPSVLILLPVAAHATGVPFLGPIVSLPLDSNGLQCAAGWGALAQVANNIIALAITVLLIFVTPAMIVWAGFLYVFSPANPSMRSKANSILKNTAIGLGFALGAWLIVDTLLTTITVSGANTGVAGFTQQLFSANGTPCLPITVSGNFTQAVGQTIDASLVGGANPTVCPDGSSASNGSCSTCTMGGCDYVLASGYSCPGGNFDSTSGQCNVCDMSGCTAAAPTSPLTSPSNTGGVAQCDPGNTSCNSQALTDAGLSSDQAAAMSCIAMTESGGGINTDNGNGTGCNSSNHCGIYQLSGTLMTQYAAAGCTQDQIVHNANNCNTKTASNVILANGYSAWTGGGSNPWNPGARSCVNSYDPNATNKGFSFLYKNVFAFTSTIGL